VPTVDAVEMVCLVDAGFEVYHIGGSRWDTSTNAVGWVGLDKGASMTFVHIARSDLPKAGCSGDTVLESCRGGHICESDLAYHPHSCPMQQRSIAGKTMSAYQRPKYTSRAVSMPFSVHYVR
jgi:hypothetical protein